MAERAHDGAAIGIAVKPEQVPIPELLLERTAQADTRHGRMWYPPQDDPIGRALNEYGEWAVSELRVLSLFALPGSTVADIGANIGTHMLSLAHCVGETGRVVAVEPQPSIFALLAQNARANLLSNVQLVNACCGAKSGFAEVPALDLSEHQNFGAVAPRLSEDRRAGTVPVVAFDSLGMQNVSLLKIDVEGMESLVLSGAARTIAEQRPVVYFEVNQLENAADAVRSLQARSYQFWFHRAPAFNPGNYRGVERNTFGVATETNVLAIPAERAESSRPLLTVDGLFPFASLDELALLLSESPRYGDPDPDYRSLERQRSARAAAQASVVRLEQEGHVKDAEIAALQQRDAEAAAAMSALRQTLDQTSDQLALLDGAKRAREEELWELRQQVVQYERHIAELKRQLERRTQELKKSSAELTKTKKTADVQRRRANQASTREHSARTELQHARTSALIRWSVRTRQLQSDLRVAFGAGLRSAPRKVFKVLARRARHARERAVIEASGLFDFDFYATQHHSLDPIGHYLTRGARAKLKPSRFFDTAYYVAHSPEAAGAVDNPLVHYIERGEPRGDWPNPTFDPVYYAAMHPEVRAFGKTALAHYTLVGANRSLPTCETAPVQEPSLPPPAALPPRDLGPFGAAPRPTAPSPEEWREALPHRPAGAVLDVVVPVYRGEADTLRCIHRVLSARNEVAFELIVIDDCSPEPSLTQKLRRLADAGLFTYLRNDINRGFVGSVNRALALHPDRDVVLLNSDTEVFNDWLDRLCATARAQANVGTITPFSNNATICSYPTFACDNDMLLEISYEELDRLASEVNRSQVLELPTGVGFCMYIVRACLDENGFFNEELFGKGYGEENDFCRRALQRGWRNLMACDIFVRHTGSASFLGERTERVANALKVLDIVHPDYQGAIRAFLHEDPVHSARARIDLERARRALGDRALAILSHNRGGGTETHVKQLLALAQQENVPVLVLRPSTRSSSALTLSVANAGPLPNLPELRLDEAPEQAAMLLHSLGVRHLHVHHLVDLAPTAPRWLESLARTGAFSVDYTVHDYSPICPRINLVGDSGVYCGEPSESECDRCIAKLGSSYGVPPIAPFRAKYRSMLTSMRRVFVPSQDVKLRLQRYFPELEISVRPHPGPELQRNLAVEAAGERLRIAVIGAIGLSKGYDVLVHCAEDARKRSLPLDFIVVGYTRDDGRAKRAGIEITGAYASDEEAMEMLERLKPHACFFPAVWPETYSYTLSLALGAAIHPVAFALGAIAERLEQLGTGTLLPLDAMRDPARVNDLLLALRDAPIPAPPKVEPVRYAFADYYDDRL